MKHPFSDLSWDISEEEYRKDPALSYSTIAKYEREGRFNSLPTLFDKTSTPSLRFGSMVDTLLTEGEEEFQNKFIVIEDPGISDTLKDITATLVEMHSSSQTAFSDISDSTISEVGKAKGFWAADKYDDVRVKKIREACEGYYNLLLLAEGKTVVTSRDVEDARRCVDVLKNDIMTRAYFSDNPFNDDEEGFYQLKFKGIGPKGIPYRCMVDRLLVNHELKVVIPTDLKTSSSNEWEFYKSFIKWRYDIQARNYWRLIRQAMDKDPYYKNFELLDYRFIVINRNNFKPLVWEFDQTQVEGEISLRTKTGYIIHLRDPYTIGEELWGYLQKELSEWKYPVGIKTVNNIMEYVKGEL